MAKSKSQTPILGTPVKGKYFPVQIKIIPTNETFTLKKVYNEMKIKELKYYAEFGTGIPFHVQRLHYLDSGDLQDHTDVRSNDIVSSSTLQMDVWNAWKNLVEAVASNDDERVFELGVTQNTDFKTPNSEYMGKDAKSQWIADRAFTALYIAAHRGYLKLCDKLIDAGADVNGTTPMGRTPLHVAAAQGHGAVVDTLLEQGADIDAVDKFSESALAVANKFGNKGCERHLFLFRWQQRAKKIKPQEDRDMFAHQYFDSAFPVWLEGKHAQIYFTQILPPGEFEGTGLNAPRRRCRAQSAVTTSTEDYKTLSPDSFSKLDESDLLAEFSTDRTKNSRGQIINGKFLGGMPSILEESPNGTGSGSLERSPVRKQTPTTPMRPKSTEVRKTHHPNRTRRTTHKGDSKPKSYEEWLKNKKRIEQLTIAQKQAEAEIKRIEEEDRKRQEELQDKSYEQWLVEKEQPPKAQTSTAQPKLQKRQTGNLPPSRQNSARTNADKNSTGDSGPLTTAKIIQNIMRRKEEEQGHRPTDFHTWLNIREEGDLLEKIRAGKTPIQMMLQQQMV